MLSIQEARTWYSENDPVHGFDHVLRVYQLAQHIAIQEGADLEIVKAAALLHDVEGDHLQRQRLDHHETAADFADCILTEEGWPPDRIAAVVHCVRSHRFRNQDEIPESLEAKVVFDADKLDAIGAIGIIRAVAYASKANDPLFGSVSEQFIRTGELRDGEFHTPYHEYLFKLSKIKSMLHTPTARAIAENRHAFMQNFFTTLMNEIGQIS